MIQITHLVNFILENGDFEKNIKFVQNLLISYIQVAKA